MLLSSPASAGGSTVTVAIAGSKGEHPLGPVTTTLYIVVSFGLGVMVTSLDTNPTGLLVQENVYPSTSGSKTTSSPSITVTVKLPESPSQIVSLPTEIVGVRLNLPPTKSSKDAVKDCEDLVSNSHVALQISPGFVKTVDKLT